jgi:serine/threonine protein kinase/tetratricopeptide (TPR) repeat protein
MGNKCPKCLAENPSEARFCNDCATALPSSVDRSNATTDSFESAPDQPSSGALFASRYQIIEELGGGGMGTVYRAVDTKVGEEIAIKTIRPEIGTDQTSLERFKNELKLARKIVHKNVGRVYDLNEVRGRFYITLEYVRGEDLKTFIRSSGQMAVGTSLRITRQVAEGLAEAHALGVVHRDLKPANIMIDRDGNARIMDFGIARLVGAKGLTGGNVIIGTPEYMSPEQVDGRETGPESDLYSLGIVLFEMLTGRVPFDGETPLSVAVKQKSSPPPDPSAINPQVPEDLNRIILRCLEKSKEKRYRSAGELLADLEKVQKSQPAVSSQTAVRRPVTSREITLRLPSKEIWIPAVAVLLVILALVTWQFLPEKETARRTIAVIGFKNQSGDPGLDYLREAIPHLLITSLGESSRLRVTSWERMKDLLRNSGRDTSAIFDEDAGFEACRREGVEAVILGSFVKAGETFATDVQVLEVSTKSLLKSASARGDGVDSILKSQIDEISRTISRGISFQPLKMATPLPRIVDLTTSSMEAYEYYLKAREADLNFFHVESRKLAEKAVALDPSFAMAYSLLSKEAGELRDLTARRVALEKAYKYSSRATEKERLFIQARYASVIEQDGTKQYRILQELVDKYPDDKEARSQLGLVLSGMGRVADAIAAYEAAVTIDPQFGFAFNQLGYAHAETRDFANALKCFNRYAELNPGLPNPVDSMAEMNLFMGNLDEATAKYRSALAIKPDFYLSLCGIAYVSSLKEDYEQAGRFLNDFAKVAPTPQVKFEALWLRNYLDYFLGRLNASLAGFVQLRNMARTMNVDFAVAAVDWITAYQYSDKGELEKARKGFQNWAEYHRREAPQSGPASKADYSVNLAWADLKAKRFEAARSLLAEAERDFPSLEPAVRDTLGNFRLQILAEIELGENRPDQAAQDAAAIVPRPLRSLNASAMAGYNTPFERDVLARAYWKQGKLNEAVAEYQRLTTIDPASRVRMLMHPLYHYRLGRVLEQKGEKARARVEYEKFLKYWAEADASHPELADARARLTALSRAR